LMLAFANPIFLFHYPTPLSRAYCATRRACRHAWSGSKRVRQLTVKLIPPSYVKARTSGPERALSLLLPVVLPDVRPVEHILSPFVGFHDEGTRDSDKQEKQSYFDNHFELPAMGGSYRFWQELRSAQATY